MAAGSLAVATKALPRAVAKASWSGMERPRPKEAFGLASRAASKKPAQVAAPALRWLLIVSFTSHGILQGDLCQKKSTATRQIFHFCKMFIIRGLKVVTHVEGESV